MKSIGASQQRKQERTTDEEKNECLESEEEKHTASLELERRKKARRDAV
jgi:hypothetical protein